MSQLFELVTSTPILDDLRRVLRYPHIRKRHLLNDEEITLFVDALALAATPGRIEVEAVEADPSDNKVLACALESGADYVVAATSSDQTWAVLRNTDRLAPPLS